MLFKRGSTISAAEGGCQAEVGGTYLSLALFPAIFMVMLVACSMASAGFAACMGGGNDLADVTLQLLDLVHSFSRNYFASQ
jgi:L-serine deaminase